MSEKFCAKCGMEVGNISALIENGHHWAATTRSYTIMDGWILCRVCWSKTR